MDEKLLNLDALSLTKYWLMSNAKIREVLDHEANADKKAVIKESIEKMRLMS